MVRLYGARMSSQHSASSVTRNLRHCLYRLPSRLLSTSAAQLRRWGLVSDIHFQEYELPRIVSTSNWILETFRQQTPRLTSIICLGDILNTKENVNLQALSATIQFFGELRKIAPVHVLVGNHDLNLRAAGSAGNMVSSLDWLSGFGYGDQEGYPCQVYRSMEKTVIDGHDCLIVPWHENHYDVIDGISKIYPDPEERKDSLLFGHLAISGATERWAERRRSKICSGILNDGHLRGFKACWMGHFHHHQRLGKTDEETGELIWKSNVGYVGAPMQHHFGDKNDRERGVVILDVDEVEPGEQEGSQFPAFEFIRNPTWDLFREVWLTTLEILEKDSEARGDGVGGEGMTRGGLAEHLGFDPSGKRIQIFCKALDNHLFEEWRSKLIGMGALDVRRRVDQGSLLFHKPGELVLADGKSTHSTNLEHPELCGDAQLSEEYIPASSFVEMVEPFVKAAVQKSKSKKVEEATSLISEDMMDYYISTGQSIMRRADEIIASSGTLDSGNNPMFHADHAAKSSLPVFTAMPHNLTITNFLGVQGTLIIPFDKLPPGTYFLQGPNGSGKSTVLEAVTWCLFGRCIRSNMSAADVVNDTVKPTGTLGAKRQWKVSTSVRLEFENGYVIERSRRTGERTVTPTLKVYYQGERFLITQEALERDVIGADYGTFVRTIVFGTGGGELSGAGKGIGGGAVDFLGLEKDKKRELVEELLGMGRFEGYATEAKERKKEMERKFAEIRLARDYLERRIAELDGRCKSLEAQIGPQKTRLENLEKETAKLEGEKRMFEEDRERTEKEQGVAFKWNELYNRWTKFMEVDKRQKDQQAVVGEAMRQLEALLKLKPFREQVENLNIDIMTDQRSVRDLENRLAKFKEAVAEYTRKLAGWEKNVEEKVCPTCEQSLPSKNLDVFLDHVEGIRQKLEETKTQMSSTSDKLRQLQEALTGKEKRKFEVVAKLNNMGVGVRDEMHLMELTSHTRERELQRLHDSHKKLLESLTKQIASYGDIETLLQGHTSEEVAALAHRKEGDGAGDTPVFLKQYQDLLKQIQDLSNRHTILSNSITKTSTELAAAQNELKEAAAELTVCKDELENYIPQFSEIEKELRVSSFWEAAFSSKKTSTTSTPNMRSFLLESSITELNTLIAANMDILAPPGPAGSRDRLTLRLSPDLNIIGSGIHAYGKRSTGQRKRNNLAVLFALFQLVRQKCRFRPEFIMLDEIFDTLDRDGQRAAGELVGGTGVKFVFIVTHGGREGIVESTSGAVGGLGGGGGEKGMAGTGGPWVIKVAMTENGTMMWDDAGVIEHIPYGGEVEEEVLETRYGS